MVLTTDPTDAVSTHKQNLKTCIYSFDSHYPHLHRTSENDFLCNIYWDVETRKVFRADPFMSKQYVLTGPPDSRSCPANFSRPYYSSLAQEITNHSTPSLMFLRRGAAAIKVGGFSVLQSFVSSEQNRAIARARVGKVLINNNFLIGSCSKLLTL